MSLTMWPSRAFRWALALCLLLALSGGAEAGGWNLWRGNDLVGAIEIRERGSLKLVALSDVATAAGLGFREEKESLFLSGAKGELEVVKNSSVARMQAQIIPLASSVEADDGLWWIEAGTALRLLNLIEGLPSARGFRWAGEGTPGARSLPPTASKEDSPEKRETEPEATEPKATGADEDLNRRFEALAAELDRKAPASPEKGDGGAPRGVKGLRWGDQGEIVRVVFDLDGPQEPKVFSKPDKTVLIFKGGAPRDLDRSCPVSAMNLSIVDEGDRVTFTFTHPSCQMKHFALPAPSRYVVDFFDMASQGAPSRPLAPLPSSPGLPADPKGPPKRSGKGPLIVLDPGHGGKDPGAVAFGLREKDLVLQISLKMEKELQRLGAEVKMTRRDDRYLKLSERTALANEWGADVFVSVHINALPAGRHATGAEIYLMALPSDKDAMALALIENKELDTNGDAAGGADKKTRLLLQILGDMQQNAKINESTVLAEAMFRRGQKGKLPMRRVAQAPFYVLRGAAMPAVLLELGFITERSEARLLADPTYQQRLVASLSPGILDYLKGAP